MTNNRKWAERLRAAVVRCTYRVLRDAAPAKEQG